MPNRIHYSPEAQSDLDMIFDYIYDVFIDRIMHKSRNYLTILFGKA